MKIKEEQQALKFLIETAEGCDSSSFSKTVFDHFGADTIDVLDILKDDGLIDFRRMGNELHCFRITPGGQKYFDIKRQTKLEYWKKFAVSHIWNIIESAIVAFITSLITLKLSGK